MYKRASEKEAECNSKSTAMYLNLVLNFSCGSSHPFQISSFSFKCKNVALWWFLYLLLKYVATKAKKKRATSHLRGLSIFFMGSWA